MTTTPPPAKPSADQPQAQAAPLTMHGQYIKDLSFENPRAPQSLIEQTQPQLTLNVQVTNRQFDAKTFEVSLTIEAAAHDARERAAVHARADLCRHGVARRPAAGGVSDRCCSSRRRACLFPFARAIVANATREAGFPPLNIAPVDFVALYRQQLDANGGKIPGIADGPVGHA